MDKKTKEFRRIKVPESICLKLIKRKEDQGCRMDLTAYILQILSLIAEK